MIISLKDFLEGKYIYVCIYIYIHIHVYTNIYIYIYLYIYIYIYIYICIFIFKYTYTYIYRYIYIYTYTYIYRWLPDHQSIWCHTFEDYVDDFLYVVGRLSIIYDNDKTRVYDTQYALNCAY
jgi:hypothetical protein